MTRIGFREAPLSGAEFRLARKRLDVRQDALAAAMGVSTQTIINWEHERHPVPQYAAAFLLLLLEVPEALAYVKKGIEARQITQEQRRPDAWTPQDIAAETASKTSLRPPARTVWKTPEADVWERIARARARYAPAVKED